MNQRNSPVCLKARRREVEIQLAELDPCRGLQEMACVPPEPDDKPGFWRGFWRGLSGYPLWRHLLRR